MPYADIDEYREYQRKYRQRDRVRIRIELLNKYGGKCNECGESDWRVLQVDHINGDGYKEKRKFKNTFAMYHYYATHDCDNIQILCSNCNWKKRYDKDEIYRVSTYRIHNGEGTSQNSKRFR